MLKLVCNNYKSAIVGRTARVLVANLVLPADIILIYGCGETEDIAMANHSQYLHALLELCREKDTKLNGKKLRLYQESTLFCGHELMQNGVRPDPLTLEEQQGEVV